MGWTSPTAHRVSLGRALALVCGVAALCGPVSLAWAAPDPEVGLVVIPAEGTSFSLARPLSQEILRALDGEKKVNLTDVLAQIREEARPPRPDYVNDIVAAVEQLNNERYRAARRTLRRIGARINGALGAVPAQDVAFVQLHLAAAEAGMGRHTAAVRTLNTLLTWQPRPTVRLGVPPPTGWRDVVTEARQRSTESPTGSLRVSSSPEGAEARVDGVRLGATPVDASNLPFGTHYVTVTKEGYQRAVMAVRVGRRTRTVSLTLRPDPDAAASVRELLDLRQGMGRARLSGINALAHGHGFNRWLLVTVQPLSAGLVVHGFFYRAGDERLLGKVRLGLGPARKAGALQPLALWRPRAALPTTTVNGETQPRIKRPWYKKWWAWTLIGAAVVTAVAVPVGVNAKNQKTAADKNEQFTVIW